MDINDEIPSKFQLCVLQTQIGKTFQVVSKIDVEMKQDNILGKSIHIIFTMNTLLNNAQFSKRLQNIEDVKRGSVCVISSKYNGKYTHYKNICLLLGDCMCKNTYPSVIVMCSNEKRFSDGHQIMTILDDKNRNFGISRVFAYYDELHSYINDSLREHIEEVHNLDIVSGITALTASPDKIWKKTGFWSNIRLLELNNYNDSNYAGFKDMIFNCIDDFFAESSSKTKWSYDQSDKQTIGFIKHVLDKYPQILENNTRSFIPAHIPRKGHNSVRDLIFSINDKAVVIIINGVEKILQYKDSAGNTKTLPLMFNKKKEEVEEVCETISRLVLKHKLENRPIVITGLLCVGMGQTLAHKCLGSFTSAIFGHLDLTNDAIYQLFGRITGRMKDWGDKYIQTQVYCPTTIMNRINVMEECAINMVVQNGEAVSQEDYRQPMNEMGEVGQAAMANIRTPKTKKHTFVEDHKDPKSIPIVLEIAQDEFHSIGKCGRQWDKSKIVEIIKKCSNDTWVMIKDMKINKVVCPEKDASYDKLITSFIKASILRKKYTWAMSYKTNIDACQIYLDNRKHRIIVSIYYGSKISL